MIRMCVIKAILTAALVIFVPLSSSYAIINHKREAKATNGQQKIWDRQTLQKISQSLKSRHKSVQLQKTAHQDRLSAVLSKQGGHLLDLQKAIKQNKELRDATIYRNEYNSTPVFINFAPNAIQSGTGTLSAHDASIRGLAFIEQNKELFRLKDPESELYKVFSHRDELGKFHVKFDQIYQGVPLWGCDLVVHLQSDGSVYAVNGRYEPTPQCKVSAAPPVSGDEAVAIAVKSIADDVNIEELDEPIKRLLKYQGPQAKQYWWTDRETDPRLAWHVQVRPNIRDNWYVFVDAESGAVMQKYNNTRSDGPRTASAVDLNNVTRTINVYEKDNDGYFMIDASRPMWQSQQPDLWNNPNGAILTLDVQGKDLTDQTVLYHVFSSDNTWNDRAAVSAHYHVGFVYDYFFQQHNRNAIDGKGGTILSLLHVTENNKPMDNAYWNGVCLIFGDGNIALKPTAGALDVVAHEVAHGIVDATVGLQRTFQPGALDESVADVFGSMVDDEDWLIGEDIALTSYFKSGASRNMSDPHNGGQGLEDPGWQPAHMNEYVDVDISKDKGGVHKNSGITNLACYLIASSIGREKTARIYYRILDANYLNKQSNFTDMRLAAVRAATDLFGESSAEVATVKSAFDAVGIFGTTGSQPPPDIPSVKGEQWIAVINASFYDNSIFLVKPVIQSEDDILQLTTTQAYYNTNNAIAVPDDGSYMLFIDSEYNLREISDGLEYLIDVSGLWKSIDISPDGSKLAATSINEDKTIYIFDLVTESDVKQITLVRPTSDAGIYDDIVVFADALDWDLTGQYLLYDALNRFQLASGESIEVWDLNLLDVANEIIISLFPPQPEGISIGNPSFSQTNSAVFTFDYIDANQDLNSVLAANLFTGEVSAQAIAQNPAPGGFNPGRPRYATDDSRIIFQTIVSDQALLYQVPVTANRLLASGQPELFVEDAQNPLWFAIGARPSTNVKSVTDRTMPSNFTLRQNYPNPFNPVTTIEFDLEQPSRVKLTVFDIMGREVARLLDRTLNAGSHIIPFNGKDLATGIYVYRLEVAGMMQKRKMLLIR